MKYFKIKIGYEEDAYISIDQSELESALYVFLSDSKGIFKSGVVRGKDIISISEDWHKEMGWNKGYQMNEDDWADLEHKGILKEYAGIIGKTKEKIQYLISTNQQNLIGKNAEIAGFLKS